MQTAKQWDAAEKRSEPYLAVLGKLLAVGIILAPLAMMLFPELNHRLGTTSRGRQDAQTSRAPTAAAALIPVPFSRSDK